LIMQFTLDGCFSHSSSKFERLFNEGDSQLTSKRYVDD